MTRRTMNDRIEQIETKQLDLTEFLDGAEITENRLEALEYRVNTQRGRLIFLQVWVVVTLILMAVMYFWEG